MIGSADPRTGGLPGHTPPAARAGKSGIGGRGLLVHAETSQARDFYLRLVSEFEPSPTSDLHLFLLMKDIRRTLTGT